VTRSSRIDGMLVCGVLMLTLIDTDGGTKDGVPAVGTTGGLWKEKRISVKASTNEEITYYVYWGWRGKRRQQRWLRRRFGTNWYIHK
jgi:hypothetical protein